MVGETLDLKTLIIKATDKEDGDLKDKVEITGGFDNNKVGTYKITYKVADSKGATATKQATVTVKEKTKSNPEPQQEPQQEPQPQPQSNPQSTPQPKPQHKAALPRTGTTVSILVLMGSVLVAMGVLFKVSKRKD